MKVVAKRKWRYPMSLERQYAKQLVAYVKRKFAVIDEHRQEIIDTVAQYAVRTDDDSLMESVSAQISVLLDRIERDMESADDLTRAMNNMFDAVNRYNASEFNALTKSLFGFPLRVPVSQISHADSAGRYRADATLDDDISTLKMAWVRQNLALIKSIDADTMRRIEDKMMERIIANVSMGDLTKYLIKDIRDIASVEVNRATLIGVDQVGKLNGRLTQYRQEHAGISEYQWETALDARVRPSHRPRQGKIYKWSNPPPDGHPGYPIRCRCVALPVIDLEKIVANIKPGSYNIIKDTSSPITNPSTIDECQTTEQVVDFMKRQDWFYKTTMENGEVFNSGDYLTLDGCDVESAKAIYRAHRSIFEKFPQMIGKLNAINSTTLKKRVYANCFFGSGHGGISVNITHFRDYAKLIKNLKHDMEIGFHPKADEEMIAESIVMHELGHAIDDYLSFTLKIPKRSKTVSRELRPKILKACKLKASDIKWAVSEYACESAEEWFAECFSEYMCNSNPRPIANSVGKWLEEIMKEVE